MSEKKNESCCVVSCDQPLDGTYWDLQWKSKTTGWDLGEPSPPLVRIIDSIEDNTSAILIPGCGSGYETTYLLEKGFTNITLIDISETACELLSNKFASHPEVHICCEDFFEHRGTYDIIIEQTFFCALPPAWRQRYVWKMFQMLNPKGILAGLLFDRQFEKSPPFGGSRAEYIQLFQHSFDISKLETAENSVLPRANSELSFLFQKNNLLHVNLYSLEGITCNGCKHTVTEIFSKIEGVKNISMSTDYSEVLIVSTDKIPLTVLEDKLSYETHYSISSINP